jgi:transcriptional accessory protein Tex/SPT6
VATLLSGDLFLDLLQNEKRQLINFELRVEQSDRESFVKEYSNAYLSSQEGNIYS